MSDGENPEFKSYGKSVTITGEKADVYTFSQVLNLTGEVTIKIYATGATGNQQMVIDNFIWVE